MERHRFGRGEYKYFDYPLPEFIQSARENLYPPLQLIANQWAEKLRLNIGYPENYSAFLSDCHSTGQSRPTPLILKYGVGGFNTLHQDLYGEIYFPIQAAFFLSQPQKDYSGGEFVLTEQTPRSQSKATVLTPNQGDLLIFTTNFRPVAGNRGWYRAKIRHGVSEVKSGDRYTLGVIFHDAVN